MRSFLTEVRTSWRYGAPNARAGMLGVFGPPGAYVPGSDMTLKVAAIRGVESHGMMCSIRELQLGDEHEGIIELPADAPVVPARHVSPLTRLSQPKNSEDPRMTAGPPWPGLAELSAALGVPVGTELRMPGLTLS